MIKKIFYIILIILLFLPVSSNAANKMWWATGLTGGGDALDGIDGASIAAGDGAIVVLDSGTTTPVGYFYRCYESSGTPSSPTIISPTTNAGTKRWHQIQIHATAMIVERQNTPGYISIYEATSDGNNYGQIIAPPLATGFTADRIYTLLDGTGPLLIGGSAIVTGSSCTIGTDCDGTSKRIAWGGTIFVTSAATVTLPAVEVGMKVCVSSKVAGVVRVNPNNADGISLDGASRLTDGFDIYSAGAIGNSICLEADSADGWTTTTRSGVWTAGS